jgi:hypothetical protein
MQVAARALARPSRLLALKTTIQRFSTTSQLATSLNGVSRLGHSSGKAYLRTPD